MHLFLIALLGALVLGCKSYKQDFMFRTGKEYDTGKLTQGALEAEKNYVIQVNDLLTIDVFTNKGERIIDPNFELGIVQGGQSQNNQQRNFDYLVQVDGNVKLPILDLVKLEGMTLQEAETILEERYNEYYKDSYVKLNYNSKRVIVLGSPGGQVIPLINENMSLVEIVAMTGGIDRNGKSHNVRLIRGELTNPEVYLIDLSTIDGMKASILNVEPGDIIYIEPRRRVFFETLRDITPILSLTTSIITLAFVIENLNDSGQ